MPSGCTVTEEGECGDGQEGVKRGDNTKADFHVERELLDNEGKGLDWIFVHLCSVICEL